MGRARIVTLLAVVLAGAGHAQAQTPAPSLSGYVTLASGYWRHGLAQNDGATLSLGVDYQHSSGFFTYGRASNVGYAPGFGYSRDVEASVYAGFHRRRPGWSWTASLGRYAYPDTGGAYDYSELSVSVGLRERFFYAASYSDDYYGWSSAALNQEISVAFPLRGDIELGGALGSFDLARGGAGFTHWNFGVSKLVGSFAIDLRYYESTYDRRSWLGDPYAERYVLSVSYAVRGKPPRG